MRTGGTKRITRDTTGTIEGEIGTDNARTGGTKRITRDMTGTIEGEIGTDNARTGGTKRITRDTTGTIDGETGIDKAMVKGSVGDRTGTDGVRMILERRGQEEASGSLVRRNAKKLKKTGTRERMRGRLKVEDKMKDKQAEMEDVEIVLKENVLRNRKDPSVVMTKIGREETKGHRKDVGKNPSVKTEETERFVEFLVSRFILSICDIHSL